MQITPKRFNYKSNGEEGIGMIAQEFEKIIPELVHGGEGSKSIGYGGLTPVLVNAIQEQQKIIEKQNSTINSMKQSLCKLGASEWC